MLMKWMTDIAPAKLVAANAEHCELNLERPRRLKEDPNSIASSTEI
jgi:hypothetical protein